MITVSSVKYAHQMLSTKKITQIYGRCRIEDGILSDTIIYNTTGLVSSFTRSSESYKKTLLKKSNKVLSLLDSANNIQGNDSDLIELFGIMRDAFSEKAVEYTFRGGFVPLIRKNIEGKYVLAYLNIDYLVERDYLVNQLYNSSDALYNSLVEAGHHVDLITLSSNTAEDVEGKMRASEVVMRKSFIATLLADKINSLNEVEATLNTEVI